MTLAQIRLCLEEVGREERQRALLNFYTTGAAIGAAFGGKEAAAKVIDSLSD